MSQIETGNGITTGFLQVLAEELDTDMSQMKYGSTEYDSHGFQKNTVVDTWIVASTGGEGGSNAMSGQGPKIRAAGAQARGIMLGMAATKLGVPVSGLTVSKGVISGGGKTTTYGELMGGKQFGVAVNPASLQPGVAPAKPMTCTLILNVCPPAMMVWPATLSWVGVVVNEVEAMPLKVGSPRLVVPSLWGTSTTPS